MKKCLILLMLLTNVNLLMAQGYSKQIEEETNGLGVFYITIDNKTSKEVGIVANVHLITASTEIDDDNMYTSVSDDIDVKPKSKGQILLMKPLVGKYPKYKTNDIAPPNLPKDSEISVRISYGEYFRTRQVKYFPAKYVNGTLFIDVPSNVTFEIK